VAFSRDIEVRFPDVDYARVVYYPRFFDYAHRVMEDFFAAEVGVPYARMLGERKVGFPTVHAEADFVSPLRFGELARLTLTVEKVSDRSLALRYQVQRVEGLVHCATLKVVVAPVTMDAFSGTTMPPEVKAAFAKHLVA
jgi:4-hydroxybenzoyl-CoA thioesterase